MSTLAEYLRHVERTYGLKPVEYRALYAAQGGRCYVCRKASGKSRRLGVDHDHLTGEVRGLVCTGSLSAMTCNRLIAIYSREALLRAAAMLSDPPPARLVLQQVRLALADPPRDMADTHHFVPSLVGGEPFLLESLRDV